MSCHASADKFVFCVCVWHTKRSKWKNSRGCGIMINIGVRNFSSRQTPTTTTVKYLHRDHQCSLPKKQSIKNSFSLSNEANEIWITWRNRNGKLIASINNASYSQQAVNIDCIQHDKNEKQDRTSIAISAIAFGIIDKPFDGRSFEEMQKKKKKQNKSKPEIIRIFFVCIHINSLQFIFSTRFGFFRIAWRKNKKKKKNGGNYEFYLQL